MARLAQPDRLAVLGAIIGGAAALSIEGIGRGLLPAPAIVAMALVACAPLTAQTRWPMGGMIALSAGLTVCLLTFEPFDTAICVAMIGLFGVALRGDRRRSMWFGAGWAVFLVGLVLALSNHAEGGTLSRAATMLLLEVLALAAGDLVRSRRALAAAGREQRLAAEHERRREAREEIARERLRIARELHDTIGHALVAINVRAGVTAHLAPDADHDGALTDIMAVSSKALEDLRGTLSLLRDTDEAAPLAPVLDRHSLGELIDRATAAGIVADTDVDMGDGVLPGAVEQAGFRVVQEALTNVLRHARAGHVRISVLADGEALRVAVVDDGIGAGPGEASFGHGLQGMAERAGALGGEVAAGPRATGGWEVRAWLPLRPVAVG